MGKQGAAARSAGLSGATACYKQARAVDLNNPPRGQQFREQSVAMSNETMIDSACQRFPDR